MKTHIIIVAGGSGTRFGAQLPKQFLPLCGKPVLMHAVAAFDSALANCDHDIVVALPHDHRDLWNDLCREHRFAVSHRVVDGGGTRYHSVKNALDTLALKAGDLVAVHDAARPLVSAALITRVLDAARCCGAAIPAVPVTDTVRQLTDYGSVTLSRELLRAIQTPQAFEADLLRRAYDEPYQPLFTDDASVVEAAGHPVTLVDGDPDNIKITHPADLQVAQLLMQHG